MAAPPPAPRLVRVLADAFREDLSPGTFAVYCEQLADVPESQLEEAVREMIRVGADRFPSIRAVRALVAERLLRLPSEEDALNQVEARVRWIRERDELAPPPHSPYMAELVAECFAHVGGVAAWRTAEEPTVIRGQFLRLYREARTARLRDAAHADFLPPPKELPA